MKAFRFQLYKTNVNLIKEYLFVIDAFRMRYECPCSLENVSEPTGLYLCLQADIYTLGKSFMLYIHCNFIFVGKNMINARWYKYLHNSLFILNLFIVLHFLHLYSLQIKKNSAGKRGIVKKKKAKNGQEKLMYWKCLKMHKVFWKESD